MRRRVSYGLLVSFAVVSLLAIDHWLARAHCFSALAVAMSILAWNEFCAMALPGRLAWRLAGALVVVGCGAAAWASGNDPAGDAAFARAAFVPALLFGALLWPTLAWDGRQPAFADGVLFATGILYLGYLPTYLIHVRYLPHGEGLAILFLLVIKLGDSGAYFFGKTFGRTKFFPVSPKKTWEGAAGGLITALATAFVGARLLLPAGYVGTAGLLGAAAVLSAIAQAGDLIESHIKRSCGTKDSAALIPELGGFLDMTDSLLFASPAFYYLLLWHAGGA